MGPPDGIVVVRHLLVSGGGLCILLCGIDLALFAATAAHRCQLSRHVSRDAAPPTGRPSDSLRSAVRARWQLMFFSLCHLMDPRVHSFELHTMTRCRGVGEKHQVYTLQSYYSTVLALAISHLHSKNFHPADGVRDGTHGAWSLSSS